MRKTKTHYEHNYLNEDVDNKVYFLRQKKLSSSQYLISVGQTKPIIEDGWSTLKFDILMVGNVLIGGFSF
jgi:hypothetical protein